MHKKRFGRLKKAVVALVVIGAAAFLFLNRKPKTEHIQKKNNSTALEDKTKRERTARSQNRSIRLKDILPERPERIKESDKSGYLSWIRQTFKPKELDCKTRKLEDGEGDNLDREMKQAGVDPFGDDMGENSMKIQKLRRFYGGSNTQFISLLEKDGDIGGLIGIVNHLDTVYSDNLSRQDICSIFTPTNCVAVADTNCYTHRNYATTILHEAVKSLARLTIKKPELSGRIAASLEHGKSQRLFFEAIKENTLARELVPVSMEEVRVIEQIAGNLYPGIRPLFYNEISDVILYFTKRKNYVFARNNTRDMQLARAIDKALENDEKMKDWNPDPEKMKQFSEEMDGYLKKRKGKKGK